MTNFNIIYNELINNGVYTQEELDQFINMCMALPVNTYQEWQKLGYKINKGEKAILKTFIWKPKTPKKQNEDEKQEEINELEYFKKYSYFFDYRQVSKI